MIHEISCDTGHFSDITSGRKSFIMQKDTDALYKVGDFLALNEITDVEGVEGSVDWTGRCCLVRVVNIYSGPDCYLQPGTIIMSVWPCSICWEHFAGIPVRDIYTVATYGPGEGAES